MLCIYDIIVLIFWQDPIFHNMSWRQRATVCRTSGASFELRVAPLATLWDAAQSCELREVGFIGSDLIVLVILLYHTGVILSRDVLDLTSGQIYAII